MRYDRLIHLQKGNLPDPHRRVRSMVSGLFYAADELPWAPALAEGMVAGDGEDFVRSSVPWKERVKALKKETFTLYLAYRHSLVPWYAKVLALLIVGYALSPIDLIPDFIPVLGYLDDLVLIPLGIMLVIRMIPAEVLAECRQKSETIVGRATRAGKIAAVVIILIWVLTAALVTWLIIKSVNRP
jgi:uncharacterized membrane protein YkvA (DUF1232 family)